MNVSNSFNFAKRVFRCGGNVSNKVSSCVNHATKLLHNCHHHADWVDCVCFSPCTEFGVILADVLRWYALSSVRVFSSYVENQYVLTWFYKLKYNLLTHRL